MSNTQAGVTLVELMIAVAIVGILAAIAYPSYVEYRQRSLRGEGQDCITSMMRRQEGFYVRNNRYADDLADLLTSGESTLSCGDNASYTLSVAPATAACPLAACYELRATAEGPQAADGDLALRFDARLSESEGRITRTRTVAGEIHSW